MGALYRQLDSRFWDDKYVQELNAVETGVYAYLITTNHCHLSGLYKLTVRDIEIHLKHKKGQIVKAMQKLCDDKKILFDGEFVWLKNFHKYNEWRNDSKKIIAVLNQLEEIKDGEIKSEYCSFFGINLGESSEIIIADVMGKARGNKATSKRLQTVIEGASEGLSRGFEGAPGNREQRTENSNNINSLTKSEINKAEVNSDKNLIANSANSQSEDKAKKSEKSDSGKKQEKQKLTPAQDEWWNCFGEYKELAQSFSKASGIIPVSSEIARWKHDLKAFKEIGINYQVMLSACRKMRSDGLTIAAPASIQKVARSLMASQSNAKNNPQKKVSGEFYIEGINTVEDVMNRLNEFPNMATANRYIRALQGMDPDTLFANPVPAGDIIEIQEVEGAMQ